MKSIYVSLWHSGNDYFIDNEEEFENRLNQSQGMGEIPILTECIQKSSNLPYWEQDLYRVRVDLRNPRHEKKLKEIRAQFGLPT